MLDRFRVFVESSNPGFFSNSWHDGLINHVFGVGKSMNLPTPTLNPPTYITVGCVCDIDYTSKIIEVKVTAQPQSEDNKSRTVRMNFDQWKNYKLFGKEPKIGQKVQIEVDATDSIRSWDVLGTCKCG